MGEFNHIAWMCIDDRFVDFILHGNCSHWLSAIGQRFRHGHNVRNHTECVRRKGCACPSKSGQHLIHHHQNLVLVTELSNAL